MINNKINSCIFHLKDYDDELDKILQKEEQKITKK